MDPAVLFALNSVRGQKNVWLLVFEFRWPVWLSTVIIPHVTSYQGHMFVRLYFFRKFLARKYLRELFDSLLIMTATSTSLLITGCRQCWWGLLWCGFTFHSTPCPTRRVRRESPVLNDQRSFTLKAKRKDKAYFIAKLFSRWYSFYRGILHRLETLFFILSI